MPKNSKHNIDQRRVAMLELLAKNGEMRLGVLAQAVGYSSMTTRRDLWYLEQNQLVQLSSGGRVSLRDSIRLDADIHNRKNTSRHEKIAIATLAATLVSERDVIGLDASTSTLELSYQLASRQNLTIITNNLLIPPVLGSSKGINLYCAGGRMRAKALSTVGEIAEHTINQFNYTKVFLSANALDASAGLTDTDTAEIQTKQAFMRNSSTVVVLADSSKVGKNALQKCRPVGKIDILVTDEKATAAELDALRSKGAKVMVAPPGGGW